MAGEVLDDDWEEVAAADDWEDVTPDVDVPVATEAAPAPTTPPQPTDRSSGFDAFVGGIGNTFGTASTVGAGLQAYLRGVANVPDVLAGRLSPAENAAAILNELKAARAENQYIGQRDRDTQPAAYLGGQLLGSLATAPVTGVGSGARATVGTGALQGAAAAASDSRADFMSGGAVDAALGAALGSAGGALGYGLGQGAKKAGEWVGPRISSAAKSAREWLGREASLRSLKAAGAINKDITAMAQRSPEHVYRTGRTLLDEGVIAPFDTVEQVGKKVDTQKGVVDTLRRAALDEADASGVPFDMGRFLERAQKEIIEPNLGDPSVAREIESVRQFLGAYGSLDPMNFSRANHLKSSLQNAQINWGNHWNLNGPSKYLEQFKMALQGIMHEEIDDQIAEAAGEGTKAAFQAAKRRIGPLIYASDRARQGFARELGRDVVGLKDMQAAQMALQSSISSGQASPTGLMMAAGAAAANKYLTGRGSSAAAVYADRASKSDWLRSLVQTDPGALGEYGAVLSAAAARSPTALAVNDYVLSQKDPEYRRRKEEAQKAALGQH